MELGSSSVKTSSLSRVSVKKGVWSQAEDVLLRECMEKYGIGKWSQVPLRSGLNRCRKSCRLRWLNYLQPSIKRGEFQSDEVDLIIRMHNLLGNRWSLIAGRIPGRTANDIKNYYNTRLLKKTRFSKHNVKGKTKVTITKKFCRNYSVQHDDYQVAVERTHPCPNSSTSRMAKVIRPVPITFPPTYKWISDEQKNKWISNASTTSTAMNHTNITPNTIPHNRLIMKKDHEKMIKNSLLSVDDFPCQLSPIDETRDSNIMSLLFDESRNKEVEVEDYTAALFRNGNSTGLIVDDGMMNRGTNENDYCFWDDFHLDDNLCDVLGDHLYRI